MQSLPISARVPSRTDEVLAQVAATSRLRKGTVVSLVLQSWAESDNPQLPSFEPFEPEADGQEPRQ